MDKDDADMTPNCRLFQVLVAATQEVRSPMARHIIGIMSADVDADRMHRCESMSVTEVNPQRGTTVLGCADSGKRAQPICTQSAVVHTTSEVPAKAALHGRTSGLRR